MEPRPLNLPDTNIWLALAIPKHTFHSVTRDWLTRQTQPASVLFCRATLHSLLRLLTTENVMRPYDIETLSNSEAWSFTENFLSDRRIAYRDEPPKLNAHWKNFAVRNTSSPKLWMDAYLAAFAVAGGYQLITTDRAFTQFQGLNTLMLLHPSNS